MPRVRVTAKAFREMNTGKKGKMRRPEKPLNPLSTVWPSNRSSFGAAPLDCCARKVVVIHRGQSYLSRGRRENGGQQGGSCLPNFLCNGATVAVEEASREEDDEDANWLWHGACTLGRISCLACRPCLMLGPLTMETQRT